MIIVIFAILGLLIGSFLNAVIYRLRYNLSLIEAHSICPHCKHALGPLDLFPVFSFVFLGGRCRYCHAKISWQYPIVEIITAICFAVFASHFAAQITVVEFWFGLIFVSFLILIAVFDLLHYMILDKVVYPAIVLATLDLIYQSTKMHSFGLHSPLVDGLIGAVIISGFFLLQFLISKGRWIGFGDVKFGILLGLIAGVGKGLVLLFLAYWFGALVGIFLILLGKKRMGSRLPFGTFLAFCGIIIMIYGDAILNWYLKLIGF